MVSLLDIFRSRDAICDWLEAVTPFVIGWHTCDTDTAKTAALASNEKDSGNRSSNYGRDKETKRQETQIKLH